MMTKDEKKFLFLLILENWIEDKSEEINSDICIRFYNYLLDYLEFESKFSIESEDGYSSFLKSCIEILTTFDRIFITEENKNLLNQGKNGFKIMCSNFSKNLKIEKLEHFLFLLKRDYNLAKKEFFI